MRARALGLLIALLLGVGPVALAAAAGAGREPYEHLGWALRALLSAPLGLALGVALTALMGLLVPDGGARGPALSLLWLYAWPAAYLLVGAANVRFDQDRGVLRYAELVKLERRDKGGERAVLRWLDDGGQLRLARGLAPERVGQAACFRVHRGALGLPWLQPAGARCGGGR